MANTLTDLTPDIYNAIDIVSRELVGMIPAVTRSTSEQRAAKDDTIRSPVAGTNTSAAVTPAATPPALSDRTVTNKTVTLDTWKKSAFYYTGEEQKGLGNAGIYQSLFAAEVAQCLRVLTNEIEAALMALYVSTSRAYGTAGTTPFASDLSAPAELKKILDDNGAPMNDRHLVINTTAGVNLRSLTQLTNVNQAGTANTLRMGELLNLSGFAIRESAQVKSHTKGTSTGQDVDGGDAVGTTSITYDGGSGGTILAGDVVANATDDADNKYVVKTAITAAGGEMVINNPGLRVAWADASEIAIGDSYTANLAFSRDAFVLAARPPQKPIGGDAAVDEMVITDPVSGLSFLLSEYPGYNARQFDISILYGVASNKPEHAAILLG